LTANGAPDGDRLPSTVPATISIGASPRRSVKARLVARTSASERLRFPGEIRAQPIINPPAPCATTIESSRIPWAMTNSNSPPPSPYAATNPKRPPRWIPFEIITHITGSPNATPRAKATIET